MTPGESGVRWRQKDEALSAARSLYRDDMTRAELNDLRRAAGTLAPVSRLLGNGESKVSRALWHVFNVDYLPSHGVYPVVALGAICAGLFAWVAML